MKPSFYIEIDGQRSTLVNDRLLAMTVTDEKGSRADRLDLVFDNRGGDLERPAKGVKIETGLGWGEAVPIGVFEVDTSGSGPGRITVQAKAVSMRKQMKAPKTRSWENQTLGQIIDAIAAEHGLSAVVSGELGNEQIPHLSQMAESDMALLSRLARERGAAAKPKGGKLLFYPRGRQSEALHLDPVELVLSDFEDWSFSSEDRPVYKSALAWWSDEDAVERKEMTIGEGDPVIELSETFATEALARRAAEARLEKSERKSGTLKNCKIGGNAYIRAEGSVRINGLGDGPDGLWIPEKVVHNVTERGWTTQFDAERAVEGS